VDEADRKEILRMLAEGSSALHSAVDGISDLDASRHFEAGGWSVLDCLEHLAVTERELLTGVQSASPAAERQHNPAREAKILDWALDRTRFIAAPEVVIPTGKFATAREALTEFEKVRAETMRLVESFEGDPRSWLTMHPMVRGPVNCYEMFLMIALHPKRHSQQIVQTRAMTDAERRVGEEKAT
jgi:hypothetical protein